MFNIEAGKLYTATCDFTTVLFDENNKIVDVIWLTPYRTLLALSKPHVRKHLRRCPVGTPIKMKFKVRQVWSCKFLTGDRVVELYEPTGSYEQYMLVARSFISPLEKTSA